MYRRPALVAALSFGCPLPSAHADSPTHIDKAIMVLPGKDSPPQTSSRPMRRRSCSTCCSAAPRPRQGHWRAGSPEKTSSKIFGASGANSVCGGGPFRADHDCFVDMSGRIRMRDGSGQAERQRRHEGGSFGTLQNFLTEETMR